MNYRTTYCRTMLTASIFLISSVTSAMTMNFEDTDIRILIKMLSELNGRHYVVDKDVTGAATLIGTAEMTETEAEDIIRLTLENMGYSFVKSASMTTVVPVSKVKQVSLSTDTPTPFTFETLILKTSLLDYQGLEQLMKTLVSGNGSYQVLPRSGQLVVTDHTVNIQNIRSIFSALEISAEQGTKELVQIIQLNNLEAPETVKILSTLYTQKYADTGLKIPLFVADTYSNSVIVSAPERDMPDIKRIIQSIDQKKKQVLVEALIIEATLEKTEEFGLDLAASGNAVYTTGMPAVTTKDLPSAMLLGEKQTTALSFVEGVTQRGSTILPTVGAIVKAAKKNNDINILSAPRILTLDDKEAQILVGKNLAYIKNSQVTPEGSTIRTFEFKDVGLLLRIKPKICDNESVKMDIHQEVEDIIGTSFEGAVETSKREATTTVMVPDGKTVIIGGLMTTHQSKAKTKLPFIHRIPLIGSLFSSISHTDEKLNLILFITPRIIDNTTPSANPVTDISLNNSRDDNS